MRIFSGSLIAALAVIVCGQAASAQTWHGRYAPPPAVVLSPDVASPWILQLRRPRAVRPAYSGYGYRAPVQAPARPTWGRSSFSVAYGRTPLAADPVRRDITPRDVRLFDPAAAPRQVRQRPGRKAEFDPRFEPQRVAYDGGQPAGTIIIDTEARYLYLVEGDGMARRYGVGVGKPGFEWAGTHAISRKSEWPDWRPPSQMIAREAEKGHYLPEYVAGGPDNPLGARAMYLGSTLYRIHGTNQPWTIGKAVSSGCIRMRNEDVIDLYERVTVGTRVIVS